MVDEYLKVGEARELLGVSRQRIANWIKDGLLPTTASPYNQRVKLVRRSDVEKLLNAPRPKTVPVAA